MLRLFFLSFSQVVSHLVSVSIGSEALQPHNWTGRVLLSSVAAAPVQVVGQPARVYPVYLLCLPGHAHLLRAAGQSLFYKTECLRLGCRAASRVLLLPRRKRDIGVLKLLPLAQPGETH